MHGATVRDSIVSAGSIISGATTESSVFATNTRIDDGATVQRSVLMDNVQIGKGAIIRNAIIDKNVVVPPGTLIGIDHDEDRRRGFHVSPGGVVVIGKGQLV